jgi:hypothetical protein
METWIGIGFAGFGVLVTIGGFVGRYWTQSVRAEIAEQKEEVTARISRLELAHAQMDQTLAATVRDSFTALREKINNVELYTEREFISRDTFGVVTAKIEKSIENLGLKIDRLGQRLPPH